MSTCPKCSEQGKTSNIKLYERFQSFGPEVNRYIDSWGRYHKHEGSTRWLGMCDNKHRVVVEVQKGCPHFCFHTYKNTVEALDDPKDSTTTSL